MLQPELFFRHAGTTPILPSNSLLQIAMNAHGDIANFLFNARGHGIDFLFGFDQNQKDTLLIVEVGEDEAVPTTF